MPRHSSPVVETSLLCTYFGGFALRVKCFVHKNQKLLTAKKTAIHSPQTRPQPPERNDSTDAGRSGRSRTQPTHTHNFRRDPERALIPVIEVCIYVSMLLLLLSITRATSSDPDTRIAARARRPMAVSTCMMMRWPLAFAVDGRFLSGCVFVCVHRTCAVGPCFRRSAGRRRNFIQIEHTVCKRVHAS